MLSQLSSTTSVQTVEAILCASLNRKVSYAICATHTILNEHMSDEHKTFCGSIFESMKIGHDLTHSNSIYE